MGEKAMSLLQEVCSCLAKSNGRIKWTVHFILSLEVQAKQEYVGCKTSGCGLTFAVYIGLKHVEGNIAIGVSESGNPQ
jgi:hypothetical protein